MDYRKYPTITFTKNRVRIATLIIDIIVIVEIFAILYPSSDNLGTTYKNINGKTIKAETKRS